MAQLDNLNWAPIFPAELGCIKGCLNYLEIPITDAWLYGSTGYAFIINIHERVISFSVGVWNKERVFELGSNIVGRRA